MSANRRMELLMGMVLLSIVYILSINVASMSTNGSVDQKEITVVLDAGHGGRDPGKISVTKELEKNINLNIAKKVEILLKEQNINVIMTRTDDMGLYSTTDSNKKSADMKARCKLINDSKAVMAVSIHQNSYPSEGVKGSQVFYYSKSENSEKLGNVIQDNLVKLLDPSNKRKAKSNTNYYMLLHTNCPSVIVECGFLSNWGEAKRLETDDYQSQVAKAICSGVIEYIGK